MSNPRTFTVDDEDLLTAAEAAAIFRVRPQAVVDLCRSGELPATKPFQSWLIHKDDIRTYLAKHGNSAFTPVEASA